MSFRPRSARLSHWPSMKLLLGSVLAPNPHRLQPTRGPFAHPDDTHSFPELRFRGGFQKLFHIS